MGKSAFARRFNAQSIAASCCPRPPPPRITLPLVAPGFWLPPFSFFPAPSSSARRRDPFELQDFQPAPFDRRKPPAANSDRLAAVRARFFVARTPPPTIRAPGLGWFTFRVQGLSRFPLSHHKTSKPQTLAWEDHIQSNARLGRPVLLACHAWRVVVVLEVSQNLLLVLSTA
jgi:hypothetical protein